MDPYSPPSGYGAGRKDDSKPEAHSGIGIASFLISLVAFMIIGFAVGAAVYFTSQGGVNEESPEMIIAGLGMFAGIGLAFVGVILGIVSCVQSTRKKLFGILGLIFNALLILGICGLMLLGMAAGA